MIFVKVSYRAELKPKAETAVELLHHSKDNTCRQVHVFFLGQFFSQAFFFSGLFFSSIVLLGRFYYFIISSAVLFPLKILNVGL